MSTIKKLFTNTRILILLAVLIFSIVAINPQFDNTGVIIKGVDKSGPSALAGIQSPAQTTSPLSRETIKSINNININSEDDYYNQLTNLGPKAIIKTDRALYTVDLENVTNPKNPLGLSVATAPKTNLKKGLDLQGGTRVLLAPEESTSSEDISLLVDNLKQRLNVYGLSDIVVKPVSDSFVGEGNQYILVEIAGANEDEVKELISTQGKFEAKIGNTTVFKGGEDITYVCRGGTCQGIDFTRGGCRGTSDGAAACSYFFEITIGTKAAQDFADVTKDLEVIVENGDERLNETLIFYLDDEQVNELQITASLKGQQATSVAITGSASGLTLQEANENAIKEMKQMQTVLVTGSLPVKLEILKTDTLSPVLGEEFLKNAMMIGFFSILTVSLVVFARYRKLEISIPVIVTMVSEVIIILGLAAMIKWNIDLAAIAGIIIAVGTGVDHQIVIADETLRQEANKYLNWSQKMKRAFFIIMAAFFTTTVAMVPLLFAGAGLLKGFALTTILGLMTGVFIARPAFAAMLEILLDK